MPFNHYFDENGVLDFIVPAYPGTEPPPNAIRLDEEIAFPEGCRPELNAEGTGFVIKEDHRGEKGWIGGEPATISELGPLPENWSATPPEPPDTRTPEEKRRAAYVAEADPIRDRAAAYQAEADAWAGIEDTAEYDEAAALAAQSRAAESLVEYLGKKREIREMYPDSEE